MKKINEQRIARTLNYIKDYSDAHGFCPTYREIKEEVDYSSLSLVSADIARLKERGVLVDDGFSHIHLADAKETHARRYGYPFLIMTDANYNEDLLDDEEKRLLEAQDGYLKGNYGEARKTSLELLKTSKDQSVLFGAKLTLCWCDMFTGNADSWKDFLRMMVSYVTSTRSEKMEKELMAHFLMSTLGNSENCPSWLTEGRFYELRPEAYPLACLLFVSQAVHAEPRVSPHYLEPLCSRASIDHIDICRVYMDLYLAMMYRYSEDDTYLKKHLEKAIKTCRKHDWLTPLAEVKKPLGSVLYPLLDEETEKKVNALSSELQKGYNRIYEAIIGENPVRDLTFREAEIINYVRLNYSTKEIAAKLYLSSETVKYYLSSIYLKLGVSGRSELKQLIRRYS